MKDSDYRKFWDGISHIEEVDYDDEKINRILRFRAVKQQLKGVRSILDVGAATGAFSIPLARLGYDVVHLDLSEEMIRIAREKAAGITNIRFVRGDAACLSEFGDDAFDLVLCFDGAISFSGRRANRVIAEICRVGRKVMLSVSNKACMAATWLNYSLEALNSIHPSVRTMMETGYFCRENDPDADALTSIAELKAYDREELCTALRENNMQVLECRSIGSLTQLYLLHLYRKYPADEVRQRINALAADEEFIGLCEDFDRYTLPDGIGSFRRAGLFALAEKVYENGPAV